MAIPVLLLGSLPYLRVAATTAIAGASWCAGGWAAAKVIQTFDKSARPQARQAMTREQQAHRMKLQMLDALSTIKSQSIQDAAQDPEVRRFMDYADRLYAGSPPVRDATPVQAAAKAA